MRPSSKFVWTSYVVAFALLHMPARAQSLRPAELTRDAELLHADSYALTRDAQADIVTGERSRWGDGFIVGKHAVDLAELNSSSTVEPFVVRRTTCLRV